MTTEVNKDDAIEVAIAPKAGSLLEKYMDPEMGLEMFGLDNLRTGTQINRLFINHDLNVFGTRMIDDLWHESFTGIILGRVPMRSMWAPRGDNDDAQPPLCQSYDNKTGYATNRLELSRTGHTTDVEGTKVAITKAGLIDALDEERIALDCGTCELSDDGTRDGGGPWHRPECSDLSSLVVLTDFLGKGQMEPCVITFKSSGLGPVHKYLDQITNLGMIPLMLETEFSLTQVEKDANNVYSVPVLARGERTDPGPDGSIWEGYLEQWESMKNILTTPYVPTADDATETPAESIPVAAEDEEF